MKLFSLLSKPFQGLKGSFQLESLVLSEYKEEQLVFKEKVHVKKEARGLVNNFPLDPLISLGVGS